MKKHSGYTLIELMVVVAILGILGIVAIPQFEAFTVRTDRSDECKKPMYEMAIDLVNFHDDNATYDGYALAANNTLLTTYATTYPDTHHTMSFAAGTTGNLATSYVLTCTQIGTYDPDCATMTLDNFGREGSSGNMQARMSASQKEADAACWR